MIGTTKPEAVRHVILDRDGVLNREGSEPICRVEDWVWEAGAVEAVARLARSSASVSIVTNQSCIARGTATEAEVALLHAWLADQLRNQGVDLVGIFVCPHVDGDGCRCRKPRPGMVLDAVAAAGVRAEESVLIGDAPTDATAAAAAGVPHLLVATGKGAGGAGAAGGARRLPDVAAAVAAVLDGVSAERPDRGGAGC